MSVVLEQMGDSFPDSAVLYSTVRGSGAYVGFGMCLQSYTVL